MKVFIVIFSDGFTPEQSEIRGVFATKKLAEKFIETEVSESLKHCFFIDEHIVIAEDYRS